MIKLKPCPFCGGKAFVNENGLLTAKTYSVVCYNCGGCSKLTMTINDTVEAWNRRADNG